MKYKFIEHPKFCLLSETFVPGVQKDPDGAQYIVARINKRLLNDDDFDYFLDTSAEDGKKRLPPSHSLWIDGMQKWVVNDVMLVMEDKTILNDGEWMFLFYEMMNSPQDLAFLGRLKLDSDLYKLAIAEFRALIKEIYH